MPEPAYPAYVVKKSEYESEPVRTVTVNKPETGSRQRSAQEVGGDIDSGGPCSGEGAGTVINGQVSPTADREIR